MPAVWGLLAVAVFTAIAATVRQKLAPVTTALWLLSLIILLSCVDPLRLDPVGGRAALIVTVGIVSLGIPAVLSRGSSDAILSSNEKGRVGSARYILVALAVLTMVLVGFRAFAADIASVTGHDFNQLTLTEIRAAQTGAARGGGVLALFGGAGPLLACLGIYGAHRVSRWWLILTVVAIAISLQSPSRLNSIGLIVTLIAFWLYIRRAQSNALSRVSRVRQILLPLVAAVVALVIFNAVGEQLGKNDMTRNTFPAYSWPSWTLSPIVYFTGGLSALSDALASSVDPFDQGSSYYAVLRAAAVFDSSIVPPETIGEWVLIPMPFNLYTGFGQVYFDLGIPGVIVAFGGLALLSVTSHRRALSGSMPAAWVSAVAANVLLTLPLGFIALNLDVLFRLLLGAWAFWFIGAYRCGRDRHEGARRFPLARSGRLRTAEQPPRRSQPLHSVAARRSAAVGKRK